MQMADIWDVLQPQQDFQRHFKSGRPDLVVLLQDQSIITYFCNAHPRVIQILDESFYRQLILFITTIDPCMNLQLVNRLAFIATQLLLYDNPQTRNIVLHPQRPLVTQLFSFFDRPAQNYLQTCYCAKSLAALSALDFPRFCGRFYQNDVLQKIVANGHLTHSLALLQAIYFSSSSLPAGLISSRNRDLSRLAKLRHLEVFVLFLEKWAGVFRWQDILTTLFNNAVQYVGMMEDAQFLHANCQFFVSLIQVFNTLLARNEEDQPYQLDSHSFQLFANLLANRCLIEVSMAKVSPRCIYSLLCILKASLSIRQVAQQICNASAQRTLLQVYRKYPSYNIIHSVIDAVLQSLSKQGKNFIPDICKFANQAFDSGPWRINLLDLLRRLKEKGQQLSIEQRVEKGLDSFMQRANTEIANSRSVKNSQKKPFNLQDEEELQMTREAKNAFVIQSFQNLLEDLPKEEEDFFSGWGKSSGQETKQPAVSQDWLNF